LLVWLMLGSVLLLPWLFATTDLQDLNFADVLVAWLAGTTNGLGLWFLFLSFRSGAKASVAIPLTALNPLLTVLLAVAFLKERLTVLQYLGVALALVSGMLLSWESKKVEQR
jgi:bacterial/archaeal transporter family protein